ncbi:MAG: hypothetical protein OXG59_04255 [Gammaproteobacteria bacterium]|nr:hypothetical protein [Gammaproteobacteria bacterium]MYH32431.1 hypothetical protein [Gammaproteobacteria bacterium]MYH34489.1 hypothetical protein [Gammaproteobacteria bacterium]
MKALSGVLIACSLVLSPAGAAVNEEAIVNADFNPLAELGRERRRQVQVRQSLKGALEQAEPGDDTLAALLEACADYLVNSMGRLDLTDMNIHNLLAARVPTDNAEVHEALQTLANRQKRARAENARLAEALYAYRQAGRSDFAVLDKALRQYHRVMSELMTPRKNPFSDYTDVLFTMDDWTNIAEVSAETIAAEDRLFDAVSAAAPDALKPDAFSGTHGMQRPPVSNK